MQRKIIHLDMDAFFAAVEQRDNPELQGKPVVVGGMPGSRGVVATASYEARIFGIRSAMPTTLAYKLCPDAIFVIPRFEAYKKASNQVFEILSRYSSEIETMSLDEAYLDVSEVSLEVGSATEIAKKIRAEIFNETGLTASAGVAPNKLIAKIASDFKKPDGLTVVPPERVSDFITEMSVRKIPGVGPVMEEKLLALRISKIKHIRELEPRDLIELFGKFGSYLSRASFGIDDREVSSSRERKSLGAEDTFTEDLRDIEDIKRELYVIAKRVSERLEKQKIQGKTLTLKITYSDFRKVTRSRTFDHELSTTDELFEQAFSLLLEHELFHQKIRLLGISISSFKSEKDPVKNHNQITQLSFPFPISP